MKPLLMYRDCDFELKQKLPWNEKDLIEDLELRTLFNVMSQGDEFLFDVAKKALLSSFNNDLQTIIYRQNILKDCMKNPAIVREIYSIAVESIEREKKTFFGFFSKYPAAILDRSIEVLQMFVDMLKKLRNIVDEHKEKFDSEGFRMLFAMLQKELSDEYFAIVQHHLKRLRFKDGVLISAGLGDGNRGVDYVLRKPNVRKNGWVKGIFLKKPEIYTFHIADRDISGSRALTELRDRGINLVANALAQSTDHILSFFNSLRTELAFYIGCMNLQMELVCLGVPTTYPVPLDFSEHLLYFKNLQDPCLALSVKRRIVGNALNIDGKCLFVITGANQGGKSTFLRSIGLSQLMMQSGMFVAAESFSSGICDAIFTHFKREEDTTMKSGKLDEELGRMSDIIDNITSNSLLLLNESFASTNEREGSEIARQIISALIEKRVRVFFVTHLYEFANFFYEKKMENVIFLRAERKSNGGRTFKLVEGGPLETSYGSDLYSSIFSERRAVDNVIDSPF